MQILSLSVPYQKRKNDFYVDMFYYYILLQEMHLVLRGFKKINLFEITCGISNQGIPYLQEKGDLNRVGGHPLFEWPTSHSTVRTVRYTALPKFTHYFAD